jgi:hypothetical protein
VEQIAMRVEDIPGFQVDGAFLSRLIKISAVPNSFANQPTAN